MLEPEFLDVIIDRWDHLPVMFNVSLRFVKEDSMVSPSSRSSPPFSRSMLTHIALLKLHSRATLEQV